MDTAMADADAGNRGARGCSDEDPDEINFDHPDWQAQVVSATHLQSSSGVPYAVARGSFQS